MLGKRIALRLALAGALLACAASAWAGPLSGSLTLLVGGLPPLGISASGTGSSSASSVTLDASVFTASAATFTITTPLFTHGVLTAANDPGAFTGSPLHGAMAIRGKVRLMRAGATAFSIPLTANGTRGVGLGGAAIHTGTPSSLLSIQGGTWTTGTVTLTGIGTPGSLRTVSLAGSDARTPNGLGTLTLVTPIRISHSSLGSVAAFGVLRLTFAPEPGAALLLLAAGALLARGVRRARRLG